MANANRWVMNSTGLEPSTNGGASIGTSTKVVKELWSSAVTATANLAIPTAAPSGPVSGKVYLWFSNTGQYDET